MSTDSDEPIFEEFVEHTPLDLLAGPHDKVSITMPKALRARVSVRAADTNFSSYIADVLAREERRLALVDYLDSMDELHGSPTDEEMAETDRRMEAMWQKYEAYLFAQSS